MIWNEGEWVRTLDWSGFTHPNSGTWCELVYIHVCDFHSWLKWHWMCHAHNMVNFKLGHARDYGVNTWARHTRSPFWRVGIEHALGPGAQLTVVVRVKRPRHANLACHHIFSVFFRSVIFFSITWKRIARHRRRNGLLHWVIWTAESFLLLNQVAPDIACFQGFAGLSGLGQTIATIVARWRALGHWGMQSTHL